MPVTHPTLTLGDKLVELIQTAWSPTAPSAVARVFEVPVRAETAASLKGQQRWVIPVGYRDEPVSRGKAKWTHHYLILLVEKFPETQSGLPNLAWADERVEQVLAMKAALDFPQGGATLKFGSPERSVWAENFEEVEVYDPELLADYGMFWSTIEVFYGEVR